MAEYHFQLPQITELTLPQQAALNETRPIALSGGPGTGKSVVSLWRHISNCQNQKRSFLLTYTSSLSTYLTACCSTQNPDAAANIDRFHKGRERADNETWDEIIIDEAQDLPVDYYQGLSSCVSYGVDDSQMLYPEYGSSCEELKALFPDNADYVLDRNFRSTQRIMSFAQVAFPDAYIPQNIIAELSDNVGQWPVLLITHCPDLWCEGEERYASSNYKQTKAVLRIIQEFRTGSHNIAILLPFRKDVETFGDILQANGITDFSIYCDNNERFPDGCKTIKDLHITTFKSAKGLEFDTVILPNFHKFKEICGSYNAEWKDYYVAVTRARSNLYLISSYDMPEFESVTEYSDL